MKMRKNELEADGFATSRIPIPSPPSTKREDALRCAAPLPERLAHPHHAEAVGVGVAVAVAAAVHEVCEQKRYKTRGLPLVVPVPCVADVNTRWHPDANANAPRLDVDVR